MKLIASLLITFSLVAGAIASITAYLPRLDSIDPAAEPLTLNAPAGTNESDPAVPFINPAEIEGEPLLTADLIEALRTNGVKRVRVKEFALGRWDGRWPFLLSVVGLVVGAMLLRSSAKPAAADGEAAAGAGESPAEALRETRAAVEALRSRLDGLESDQARSDDIVDTLDELRGGHLEMFVEAHTELVGRLGMAGFAQLMDRFAAAERQLNRAWSSAADGVLVESRICLDEACTRLDEAIERL